MGTEIVGLAEIERNIEKYVKVAAQNAEQGLEEAAQRTVGIVKTNAPVDSGRLRNSISYITKTDKGGLNDGGGEKASNDESIYRNKPKKNQAIVGTNVVYGERVEFFAKTGSKGFFERAIKQARPIVKEVLKVAMKRGLK